MTNKQWTELGIATFLFVFFIAIKIADRRKKKQRESEYHGPTEED